MFSDNYVELSENYVDLSENYIDLLENSVDLSENSVDFKIVKKMAVRSINMILKQENNLQIVMIFFF